MNQWIVCQLGAREHYAIPRALHQAGQLQSLITDAWVKPQSILHYLPGLKSLRDRYHPDLINAPVRAFTTSLIQFELVYRYRVRTDWDHMMARNHWFQEQVLAQLQLSKFHINRSPILFCYSYSALKLLRYAKQQGWATVLGQIDPGILEEEIVAEEHAKYPSLAPQWKPAPLEYWQQWQQECEIADQIVVNSKWSKQLLEKAGVNPGKIKVVSLIYQPSKATERFVRTYPSEFTKERPLKVLFLGLITIRKGIRACLEAIEELKEEPIEFWFVGSEQINIPVHLKNNPKVLWIGPVSRSEVQSYYQQADVFLFPSLSDGFGLTQLEAQAWKLPIIASRCCGQVVQHHYNGFLLNSSSAQEIAKQLRYCQQHPFELKQMSQNSTRISFNDKITLQEKLNSLFSNSNLE